MAACLPDAQPAQAISAGSGVWAGSGAEKTRAPIGLRTPGANLRPPSPAPCRGTGLMKTLPAS